MSNDYYEIEFLNHDARFILDDNMEVMRGFDDNEFDLVIADPPYGINAPNMQMGQNLKRGKTMSTAQKMKGRLNRGSGKLKNRILNKSDIDWDDEIPTPEYFEELFRVSKNQIIWGGNYFPLPPTRCIVCWDKVQPWENFSQIELAWTSFDYPAKLFRKGGRGGANTEAKIHPTQKPVAVYQYLLKNFASEGMKILDPNLGSGSSAIACEMGGFKFTGIEKNKGHFFDAVERFQAHIKKPELDFLQKHKQITIEL
jgi:site-specific DNA-methyltransferase (adenine-specific)